MKEYLDNMSLTSTWNDENTWSLWTATSGNPRVYDNEIKLPFNRIYGFSDNIDIKAIWEIGNFQNLNDISEALPESPLEPTIGDPVTLTQIVEDGILSPSRNGYVFADTTKFDYPNTNKCYMGVWFKSNISDYSQGRGYILIYASSLNDGEIGYAIFIDTDNRIKAAIIESGSTTILTPIGGDVLVDENWHVAVLIPGVTSGSTLAGLFVDNQTGTKSNVTPEALAGSPSFSIGSNIYDSFYGFSGIVDEPIVAEFTGDIDWDTKLYRFSANTFLSPVIDSGISDNLILETEITYDTPENSVLVFYFRASNTVFEPNDSDPSWIVGIPHYHIPSGTPVNLKDMGLYITGRYYEVRVDMIPSDDNLNTYSPSISSLSVKCGLNNILLASSASAITAGSSLEQIINFNGTKHIDKVALDLSVTNKDRKDFFVGSNGIVSFSAANFQYAYQPWVFQPIDHVTHWNTSNITIGPTFRESSYVDSPYLQYEIYLDESGEYDLWGYGYTDTNTLYWSWDNDNTDLREVILKNSGLVVPQWKKFGTIYIEEGGLHTFTVYLGDEGDLLLDQFYFTNKSVDMLPVSYPWPVSQGPFNTMILLESLTDGEPDSENMIASWLSSVNINASGKFNYLIMDNPNTTGKDYTDGLSMLFMQIGGSDNFNASWNFSFVPTEDSVGSAYSLSNYRQYSRPIVDDDDITPSEESFVDNPLTPPDAGVVE